MANRDTIPAGLNQASLLADTGRELGPDIQLTVVKEPIPTAGGPRPAMGANLFRNQVFIHDAGSDDLRAHLLILRYKHLAVHAG
jgi:hypothetical protein